MHIALVITLSLWTAACGAERRPTSDPRYAAATKLSTSCGGGFAGTYGGTTVHRDGRVESWVESRAPEDGRRAESTADPKAVAMLFELVERIGFLDMPTGQPSNWCCSLELSDPAGTFVVYWEQDAPEGIDEIIASILALAPEVEGEIEVK